SETYRAFQKRSRLRDIFCNTVAVHIHQAKHPERWRKVLRDCGAEGFKGFRMTLHFQQEPAQSMKTNGYANARRTAIPVFRLWEISLCSNAKLVCITQIDHAHCEPRSASLSNSLRACGGAAFNRMWARRNSSRSGSSSHIGKCMEIG